MSIEDFVSNFTRLEVCHLTADAFGGVDSAGSKPGESGSVRKLAGKVKQCWTFQKEFSTWRRNVSAGGGNKVSFYISTEVYPTYSLYSTPRSRYLDCFFQALL